MAVLTGRSGQLYVDGARVSKVTGWSLDEQRPMLDSTPVDVWDQTVVPGRRSGTGSAKLLYDPEDAAAGVFFDSILLNTKSEVPVSLILDSLTGESYPVAVHVSGASHAVARGEAQMRDISFKLSDIGIELEIIGNAQAAEDATQLYTGAIYGLSGAWTFLWTSSGPTIADPTSQSTNVTFPDLGTFTLTLTATLGTTVLTDTLTIEVIDVPLMMISRPTSLTEFGGDYHDATCCIDSGAQEVYHASINRPDPSVATPSIILSRVDYTGTRLATKRITGYGGDSPIYIQKLASGELFFATTTRRALLSADLSTILWQSRNVDTIPAGFAYSSAENKIYFQDSFLNATPSVGYINLSTGVITKAVVTLSPSFTPNASAPIVLQNGKVLFVFPDNGANVFSFIECNQDLRVGGIYQPIRSVEHTLVNGFPKKCIILETDNYIAVVFFNNASDGVIGLFNKSDYSYVKAIRYGPAAGTLVAAFYRSGEIIVAYSGMRVLRLSEDLTMQLSNDQVSSTNNPSGPPWGANPATLQIPQVLQNCPSGSTNGYDAGLGLVAVNGLQKNADTNVAEMLILFRVSYGAPGILDYGPWWMTMNPDTAALTETSIALSGTISRAYTFTETANTASAGGLSIANETNVTFDSYVLTT